MNKSKSPAEYIYILGHGGSGSTLLELLLANHPQITAMGELEKLSLQFSREDRGRCSCGERPMNCPVWRAVADAVKERYHFDLSRHPFSFRVSDVGREEDHGLWAVSHFLLRQYYRGWRYVGYCNVPLLRHGSFLSLFHRVWARNRFFVADIIRNLTGATGAVDSSKDYIGVRDLYSQAAERMRIIFITRDVRGSVWSSVKRGKKNLNVATRSWVKANKRSCRMLRGIPRDAWICVKYEELCADVVGVCKDLCEFLGYDCDPVMFDFNAREQHTIGGNKIRYTPINEIREDLSWQTNLSTEDICQIERISDRMAKEIGY